MLLLVEAKAYRVIVGTMIYTCKSRYCIFKFCDVALLSNHMSRLYEIIFTLLVKYGNFVSTHIRRRVQLIHTVYINSAYVA